MEEILRLIDKARNRNYMWPDVSDMWNILNAIEKVAQDELNNPVPPWRRKGKDE